MSGETQITIVGNLTADPELRFTSSGVAVAKFNVASTPRLLDKGTGQWKDGETLFLGVSVWREQAEHVAESLSKGSRVIVTGTLGQRNWEDKDGGKRTSYEITAFEVGPSLLRATAKPVKVARTGGTAASADSWDNAKPAGGGGFDDEPPF